MPKPSRRRDYATMIQDKERMTRSFAKKLEPELVSMFARQTREAIKRISLDKAPVSDSIEKKWSAQWVNTQFSFLSNVSYTGGQIALMQLGIQADQKTKAAGTGIGMEFDLDDYERPLKVWLEKVASFSTRIHAGRIERIWEQARKEGHNVAKITRQIKEEMPYFGANRARMIALTNTNWCMNSGMRLEHRKMGVNVFEWMTSRDDSVCPFCGRMDGVKVQGDDPFWDGDAVFGVEVLGDSGKVLRTMKLPHEIYHPPLHPRCVCTLLAVLTSSNVLIDGTNNAGDYSSEFSGILADLEQFTKASVKLKAKIPGKPSDLGIHGTENMNGSELLESIRKMDRKLDDIYPDILEDNSKLYETFIENAKKLDKLTEAERQIFVDWYHRGFEFRTKDDILESLTQKSLLVNNSQKTSIFYEGSDDIIEAIGGAAKNKQYKNGVANVRKAVDFINSITNKNVSGQPIIRVCHLHGTNRAFQSAGSIYIDMGKRRGRRLTDPSVIVHELAHGIDDRCGSGYGITKKLKPLYRARTKDDHLERFVDVFPGYGYKSGEVFKRDKWQERGWNLYIGKEYSYGPLEMTSMCYQSLFENAVRFSRNDPELFELFINIIRAKGQ